MLADAEHETLASLALESLATGYPELAGGGLRREGKTDRALLVWRDLVHEAPDYEPARTNLAILGNQSEVALGETAVVVPLSGRRQSHQR